jgi:hypothetical protein
VATEAKIKDLQKALATIIHFKDKDDLISRPKWGEISFEDAEEDINLVFSIASDLQGLPLQHLTDTAAQHITQHIPAVAEQLKAIDNFSLTGDASKTRDQIASALHGAAENLNAHSAPWIPYLAYRRGDVSANIAQLSSAVDKARTILEAAEVAVQTKAKEIDSIIAVARDASASVGVATFTQEFDQESTTLKDRSKVWLVAAGLLAALTIGAAFGSYYWPRIPEEATGWQTLRNVVSKAAIIAVLFTGTLWCGTIYRALMHQATVNRHRALSLKTFQAFVKATDDARVKDAVLLAATRTVFGSVPTGLVTEGRNNQESGIQFVEIGKSSAEKITTAASE